MDSEAEPDEAREEAAFLERLRAAGVKLREKPLEPLVAVKPRPKWLAFLVRTFRLDRD